jgi:hypothetical protein
MNFGEVTQKVLALFGVEYERRYYVAKIGQKNREKQMYEA